MGVTKLRLARFGCRNRPFYRIVAIDSRKARDDAPIEYVCQYVLFFAILSFLSCD